MREVDRLAFEEYHVPGIVLMENAARAVTDVVTRVLERNRDSNVMIMCGGGNNGGDGLAIARQLHNRCFDISIALFADPSRYQGDALTNWHIVRAMRLPVLPLNYAEVTEFGSAGVIVDAIFGTGLTQPPREPFREIVHAVTNSGADVVAVDVPSGLDCDTGEPLGPCIRAAHTVTFVAEKVGFLNPRAQPYLGEVTVADIGCPRELIEEVARDIR